MAAKLLAVIGANFGDEGKGRTVDWLAYRNKLNPVWVVRHNSGGQAGHTVERKGKRHVFSHFGSGTLQGIPTLLAHRFVVDPERFCEEYDRLQRLGLSPQVVISRSCAMTTPLDMMLNQITETLRENRHGSCGAGFGETIERGMDNRFWIDASVSPSQYVSVQQRAEDYFKIQMRKRFTSEQIDSLPDMWRGLLESVYAGTFRWSVFWNKYRRMQVKATMIDEQDIKSYLFFGSEKPTLIFEGAQGLKLHQDTGHGAPDHATWSRTGTQDILEFLENYDIPGDLEAYYVSRAYITRHGNGPLLNEWKELPSWIVDPTNVTNEWQGSLRAAPFNLEYIEGDILIDCSKWYEEYRSKNLSRQLTQTTVLTCADQVPEVTNDMLGFADYVFSSPRNGAPMAASRYRANQEKANGIDFPD